MKNIGQFFQVPTLGFQNGMGHNIQQLIGNISN